MLYTLSRTEDNRIKNICKYSPGIHIFFVAFDIVLHSAYFTSLLIACLDQQIKTLLQYFVIVQGQKCHVFMSLLV